jgi:hypothetical protein
MATDAPTWVAVVDGIGGALGALSAAGVAAMALVLQRKSNREERAAQALAAREAREAQEVATQKAILAEHAARQSERLWDRRAQLYVSILEGTTVDVETGRERIGQLWPEVIAS